jgi:hypothetical protein
MCVSDLGSEPTTWVGEVICGGQRVGWEGLAVVRRGSGILLLVTQPKSKVRGILQRVGGCLE